MFDHEDVLVDQHCHVIKINRCFSQNIDKSFFYFSQALLIGEDSSVLKTIVSSTPSVKANFSLMNLIFIIQTILLIITQWDSLLIASNDRDYFTIIPNFLKIFFICI